jgi:hypothetical protein
MARFYFHLKGDGVLVTDDEGLDLPSTSEATKIALASARELLADAIKFGKTQIPEAIIVADAAGQPMLEVPFVQIIPDPLKKFFI